MTDLSIAELKPALQNGLLSMGLSVDTDKITSLLFFIELIEKWNKAYNLTAIRKPEAMIALHLLDSLAISPYLNGAHIIDVGTGAGLPGIPLAILHNDKQFCLLDSNAKKTRFVKQAVMELGLHNAHIINDRVETYHPENPFDTVICRAFAEIDKMFLLTRHLLSKKGRILAMKAQLPGNELNSLSCNHHVDPLAIPGITAERCLVTIYPETHE